MRAYYNKDKRKYNELSYERKYLLDPKYMTKRDLQHYYRYYNMTKNRSQFKKIIVVIFCLCLFSYVFVDYNLRTKLLRLRDHFGMIRRIDAFYNTSKTYFVDTPGCSMPYFEVTDDIIIQFMKKPKNYTCTKALLRTADVGSRLLVNMNGNELWTQYGVMDLDAVNCSFNELQRKSEYANEYGKAIYFNLNYDSAVEVPPNVEFIRVQCYNQQEHIFYKDYHFFTVEKNHREVIDLSAAVPALGVSRTPLHPSNFNKTLPFTKKNKTNHKHATIVPPDERISVMVLGIDSISHLNFLRHMPRTAAYIHKKLPHVEFWGFNKVGDNTYPNLVPVLTGLDETELNISCLAPYKIPVYDRCAFIWKRYKEAGYRTVFAEDVAKLGLFNFCRKGFKLQPTDYYLRPIMMDMERNIGNNLNINVNLCMGGRRTVDVLLEYIKKLLPRFKVEMFFSFFWLVTMTHDHFNSPALLDDAFVRLLEDFASEGIFNRTLIMMMSDHGLRWGSFRSTYQGMMEERQPLLMTIYPKWFAHTFPQAIANLKSNARRLTTPYDLHATLIDLLDLANLRDKNVNSRAAELVDVDSILPRGISLFLPITEQRTCDQANIEAHWCTCHQREEIQTNDLRVQRAARYLVSLMNQRLKPHPQCRTLYLNSIMQAFIAAPHRHIVKNIHTDYAFDITLRLQTKPGMGIFESTVRMSDYQTKVTGSISRLNLYGSQSYCIDDYKLKMFCYCYR